MTLLKSKYAIYFILFFAFIVRLINIESPLIGVHSWRQADTASISRNYYENGYRFLYPQIDWGGSSPGFVETEFPVYQYLVALIYRIFGLNESFGRLLSVIFSLLTLLILYHFVLRIIDRNTALWASLFYSFLPTCIYYSRSFQPESLLLLSSVLGIYLFLLWADTDNFSYLVVSAIFISLACLIKPPSLYLGLPLLYLCWHKMGKHFFFDLRLWFYVFLIFLPIFIWYFHAHQIYKESGFTFGIWGYGIDKWGKWDILFTIKFWDRVLGTFLIIKHFSIIGFFFFFFGIFVSRKSKQEKVFDFWLLAVVIYILIVGWGNYVHEYYQLPLIIPAVVYIGKLLNKRIKFYKNMKLSVLLVVFIVITFSYSIGQYFDRYLKKENIINSIDYYFATAVKNNTDDEALVIALTDSNPTVLYLSKRKGWLVSPTEITDSWLLNKTEEGAKYLIDFYSVFNNESLGDRLANLSLVDYKYLVNNGDFFIIKLF